MITIAIIFVVYAIGMCATSLLTGAKWFEPQWREAALRSIDEDIRISQLAHVLGEERFFSVLKFIDCIGWPIRLVRIFSKLVVRTK